jgi:hypothetical protein
MNVSDKIQQIEREIETRKAMVAFLNQNREFLESFEGTIFESCGTVYFTNHGKLGREAVLSIIRNFHGKWNKTYDQDKVSYEREKSEHEAFALGIYEAEAPVTCQIVEEEVEVPAHKVIKRRLVCAQPVEEVTT